jgi:pyridoxamine 5'-phosphate oxidase-like protein
MPAMARWDDVEKAEPDFARRVRRVLDAHKHKTLATLRRDGSPRISGIEADFAGGELWLGSMPGAVKALDLRRDPRFALHSGSVEADEADPGGWPGDAKVAGRAVELTDPAELEAFHRASGERPQPGGAHLFRLDLTEVVLTWVDPPDQLVIESWHEGRGYQRRQRR